MTVTEYDDEMIDMQAYDDERPDDDDMPPPDCDPAAERMAANLDKLDAAADWRPEPTAYQFAPSFDEWNAIRGVLGQLPGTFGDYLADINDRAAPAGNPIVAMLARKWVTESNGNGAGELPADWINGPVPF